MPNIRVSPEQLQSVASQLNSGAATIESTLSQLAAQVSPLQSEWEGVAQARFQELWAEWQRSSQGIKEALTGISQLTMQAGSKYEGNERRSPARSPADRADSPASREDRLRPVLFLSPQTSTTTGSTIGRRFSRS